MGLGSGTTLIAAETTGRVCLAIELKPRHVDVAVRRWQAFTGKHAPLESTGRHFDEVAAERGGSAPREEAAAPPSVGRAVERAAGEAEAEMRGRRPKPTRLKVLTGNPGKRPLNPTELAPEPAIPECAAELGPVARRERDRLVGELAALRLLTNLDRAALAACCGAYALWAESMEAIQKYGTMIKSPSGYPVQSPYVAIANRQAEIMMRIAAELASLQRVGAGSRLATQKHPRCSIH